MREIEELLRLLKSVPFLHVDLAGAQSRGDRQALDYAEAVERWQSEAARVITEVDEQPVERRDAFARIAVASELIRLPHANRNEAATAAGAPA